MSILQGLRQYTPRQVVSRHLEASRLEKAINEAQARAVEELVSRELEAQGYGSGLKIKFSPGITYGPSAFCDPRENSVPNMHPGMYHDHFIISAPEGQLLSERMLTSQLQSDIPSMDTPSSRMVMKSELVSLLNIPEEFRLAKAKAELQARTTHAQSNQGAARF